MQTQASWLIPECVSSTETEAVPLGASHFPFMLKENPTPYNMGSFGSSFTTKIKKKKSPNMAENIDSIIHADGSSHFKTVTCLLHKLSRAKP